MAIFRFQCPECGLGDYEVGHLVVHDELVCVVCLEEQGRRVTVRCWEECAPTEAVTLFELTP
jgi:hypothetical protein